MDCVNKELLAGTDLCDGLASYCHKCVDHSNVVVQSQNEILKTNLKAALLKMEAITRLCLDRCPGGLLGCAMGECLPCAVMKLVENQV